ncbi:CBS domain-containing protein [Nocardioides ungokensis]|uniref:CBS domain-containing protein n=1 Tax=Nocardioides ungokensis TaxID=1643322 RepID=UPI0015DF7578|nr:CBS domain-containing protein [Nocardioides ungokensis]
MLVRELMSTPAVTVRPDASVKEAARQLTEHGITAMPVVDRAGALVGVISEADVIRDAVLPDQRAHERPVYLTDGPYGTRVRDVMSHFPLSVRTDADLAAAAELMTGTAVKSLPVVERGVVVGMVSRRDIVAVLARSDQRIEGEVDELLRSAGLDVSVEVVDGVVVLDGPEETHQQEMARVLVGTVQGVVGIRFGRRPASRGHGGASGG